MEKHRPYTNIIENKLQQLPGADVNDLWSGMHTILDQKMPQQEKKRRVFGWLFTGKTMFICSSILLLGAASYLFSQNSFSKQSLQSKITSNGQQQTNTRIKAKEESVSKSEAVISPIDNKDVSKQSLNDLMDETIVETKQHNLKTNKESANAIAQPSISALIAKTNKKDISPNLSTNQTSTALNELSTKGISSSSISTSPRLRKMNIAEKERLQATNTVTSDINRHFTEKLGKETDSLAELRRRLMHRDEDKGMYVGLMAGLDLSSVHFNSFNSGSNTGALLGYSFNKKWSIETGLYWSKKNFIGDSGTFTLKNYTVQQGVKILSAKGDVHLYEVPVSVRYNLLPYQNKLFIAAGISSYFMKWENYRYGYEYNGQSGYSYFSPQNATKNWFSVANFSVGYSYKLGTVGSVRIEPYLKMPLKNIGFCNMAVMSTGLNIGFTRQLSRN